MKRPGTPLAIIGIGCIFPKADSLPSFWANIRSGVDAITAVPATHWRPEDYFDADPKSPDRTYARRGGFLPPVDFNPLEFGISPNTLEATDATQLLGLMVARAALRDAGYAEPEARPFDRRRTSVILGVTGTLQLVIPLGARLGHPIWRKALADAGVEPAVADDVVARIADGYVPWQENSFPGLLGNVAAGRIANRLDLGGTNCVVDAACASSLGAVHLAGLELESGRCDLAITGGFDTFNDIFMYMCFSKTPALSPSGDVRPFSSSADGTILGEGLGAVVLKRLDDARHDGDRIYAVLTGIGSSSDGKGNAIYAPSARGQAEALRAAYQQAGIGAETIELVEAHGTGTKVGDATELEGLTTVFREARPEGTWCALGSIKSQIGHTKAAAGVAGLIKTALALHHKVLPPTIKVDQPAAALEPGASPFYLSTAPRPWLPTALHPRRAGLSAFGFGGSNFHCVIEEAEPSKREIDWDGRVQLMALSGASPAAVQVALDGLRPELAAWDTLRGAAARSRVAFRASEPCRLALVVEQGVTDIDRLVDGARRLLSGGAASGSTPDGAYFASGPRSGSLGFVFPGQGSQAVGMMREWACVFPAVFAAIEEANLPDADGVRLSDRIYPPTAFQDAERNQQEEALRSTDVAQPAIGVMSLGALHVLEHFGLRAEAAIGHSFGELTALCAAGAIDEGGFHRLAIERGRLMSRGEGDRGGMLAVLAGADEVERALTDERLELVLANRNAPKQQVLSGPTAEIERAQQCLEARGMRCRRLPVAAAFHSRFVADASAPFAEALARETLRAPEVPVFANTTAEPYPADPQAVRDLLAGQLARPVEFARSVVRMHDAGVRLFVEVGPGDKLTGLVRACLEADKREFVAMAVDARPGLGSLARVLAQWAVLGGAVELTRWDTAYVAPEPRKPGMTVSLSGVNYVKPRTPRPPAPPRPAVVAPAPVVAQVVAPMTAPPRASTAAAVPVRPQSVPAAASPSPVGVVPQGLADALRATQEGIVALQRMQSQAAELHQRFLASQNTAQETVLRLVEQQQSLVQGRLGAVEAPAVLSTPATIRTTAPVPPQRIAPVIPPSAVVTPTPAPTPAQPRAVVAPPAPADDRTARVLLEVVADKTGYPTEMLNLDMGLDSDLGIDSIKRVEILSALQERLPDAPRARPEDLGRFQTLRQIVEFLGVGARASAPSAPAPVASSTPPGAVAASARVSGVLLEVVAEKTGYPTDMLNLDMGLDSDLGIDSIKRVEILSALQERLPEAPRAKPEDLGRFRTLRQIAEFLAAGAAGTVVVSTPVAVAPAVPHGRVSAVLLEVVAEKTGYPTDMLNLDMGLDSDLGIDSIKRVEILSALQERLPEAPRAKPEDLGRFRTLRQIAEFLGAGSAVAATAAVASPPVAAPSNRAASVAGAAASGVLLAVVADKTGYPVDMLNLDMGLDSDLGIDSIKRVEILSALQERLPEAPRAKPEDLGRFRTLRQIAEFLAPASAVAPTPAPAVAATRSLAGGTGSSIGRSEVSAILLEVVAEKTGYPADMLQLDMGLDADLGIDSIKRVEILSRLQERLPQAPPVKPEDLGRLRTLRHIVDHLAAPAAAPASAAVAPVPSGAAPAPTAPPPAAAVALPLERSVLVCRALAGESRELLALPAGARCWITRESSGLAAALAEALRHRGLDPVLVDVTEALAPERLSALILVAPPSGTDDGFLVAAFRLMQLAGPALRQSGRVGGALLATIARLDGAFGLGDLPADTEPIAGGLAGLSKTAAHEWNEVTCRALDVAPAFADADAVAGELLCAGPVEVGIDAHGPRTLELSSMPLPGKSATAPVSAGDLIVITGGARGVTAEVATAMAQSWQATLLLLGRSPEPTPEPDWLRAAADEAGIKKALLAHAGGTSLTPRALGDESRRRLANREVLRSLERMRATGAAVMYRSVDVRDPAAVRAVIESVCAKHGPVRGVVHGAGVLADRRIEDKTVEQFSEVYATKVAGLRAVLAAVGIDDLRFLALFSSSTGRFGRTGQVDYAVANEVLNKLARQQARMRPRCRVVSINWGPWEGGMVTPGLRKVFEGEGVGLIPLAAGAQHLLDVVSQAPGPDVESVVLGPSPQAATTTALRVELDVDRFPFLRSHVIDGKAVLPAAMMMEWLSQAALHATPGMAFIGLDDFRVLKGVILDPTRALTLHVNLGAAVTQQGITSVPAELRSTRSTGGEFLHARATVRLAAQALTAEAAERNGLSLDPYPHPVGERYESGKLFHGPDLQGIAVVEGCSSGGIAAQVKAAPAPASWIRQPLRGTWVADPLALDCAFQLMILWSQERHGVGSLPTGFAEYRQFRRSFPRDGVRIAVRVRREASHAASADIEFLDRQGTLVARMRGGEFVLDASLEPAFQRNRLSQEAVS